MSMEFQGEISVTYTDGVLKPDQRLDVPEGSRFRAMIQPAGPVPPDPAAAAKAMDEIKRIRATGAFRSGGRRFTRDQMHERS
jgi:predicted DNA-binding antitoxin AbrB/MazE fold protein